MNNELYSAEYEDAIIDLINTDNNLPAIEILCYLPKFNYETNTKIDGVSMVENFDVFKVRRLDDNRECYLCYGDHFSFRFSGLKTVMKYYKRCNY